MEIGARSGFQYQKTAFVRTPKNMPSSQTKQSNSTLCVVCLLYTSDAADERSSVDLGGRRIIKKKKNKTKTQWEPRETNTKTHTR